MKEYSVEPIELSDLNAQKYKMEFLHVKDKQGQTSKQKQAQSTRYMRSQHFIPPTHPVYLITSTFDAPHILKLQQQCNKNYIQMGMQTSKKKLSKLPDAPTDRFFIVTDDSKAKPQLQGQFLTLSSKVVYYPNANSLEQVIEQFKSYVGFGRMEIKEELIVDEEAMEEYTANREIQVRQGQIELTNYQKISNNVELPGNAIQNISSGLGTSSVARSKIALRQVSSRQEQLHISSGKLFIYDNRKDQPQFKHFIQQLMVSFGMSSWICFITRIDEYNYYCSKNKKTENIILMSQYSFVNLMKYFTKMRSVAILGDAGQPLPIDACANLALYTTNQYRIVDFVKLYAVRKNEEEIAKEVDKQNSKSIKKVKTSQGIADTMPVKVQEDGSGLKLQSIIPAQNSKNKKKQQSPTSKVSISPLISQPDTIKQDEHQFEPQKVGVSNIQPEQRNNQKSKIKVPSILTIKQNDNSKIRLVKVTNLSKDDVKRLKSVSPLKKSNQNSPPLQQNQQNSFPKQQHNNGRPSISSLQMEKSDPQQTSIKQTLIQPAKTSQQFKTQIPILLNKIPIFKPEDDDAKSITSQMSRKSKIKRLKSNKKIGKPQTQNDIPHTEEKKEPTNYELSCNSKIKPQKRDSSPKSPNRALIQNHLRMGSDQHEARNQQKVIATHNRVNSDEKKLLFAVPHLETPQMSMPSDGQSNEQIKIAPQFPSPQFQQQKMPTFNAHPQTQPQQENGSIPPSILKRPGGKGSALNIDKEKPSDEEEQCKMVRRNKPNWKTIGLNTGLERFEQKEEEIEKDYQLFLPQKHPENPSNRPGKAPPTKGSDYDPVHEAADRCRAGKPQLKTSSGPFKLQAKINEKQQLSQEEQFTMILKPKSESEEKLKAKITMENSVKAAQERFHSALIQKQRDLMLPSRPREAVHPPKKLVIRNDSIAPVSVQMDSSVSSFSTNHMNSKFHHNIASPLGDGEDNKINGAFPECPSRLFDSSEPSEIKKVAATTPQKFMTSKKNQEERIQNKRFTFGHKDEEMTLPVKNNQPKKGRTLKLQLNTEGPYGENWSSCLRQQQQPPKPTERPPSQQPIQPVVSAKGKIVMNSSRSSKSNSQVKKIFERFKVKAAVENWNQKEKRQESMSPGDSNSNQALSSLNRNRLRSGGQKVGKIYSNMKSRPDSTYLSTQTRPLERNYSQKSDQMSSRRLNTEYVPLETKPNYFASRLTSPRQKNINNQYFAASPQERSSKIHPFNPFGSPQSVSVYQTQPLDGIIDLSKYEKCIENGITIYRSKFPVRIIDGNVLYSPVSPTAREQDPNRPEYYDTKGKKTDKENDTQRIYKEDPLLRSKSGLQIISTPFRERGQTKPDESLRKPKQIEEFQMVSPKTKPKQILSASPAQSYFDQVIKPTLRSPPKKRDKQSIDSKQLNRQNSQKAIKTVQPSIINAAKDKITINGPFIQQNVGIQCDNDGLNSLVYLNNMKIFNNEGKNNQNPLKQSSNKTHQKVKENKPNIDNLIELFEENEQDNRETDKKYKKKENNPASSEDNSDSETLILYLIDKNQPKSTFEEINAMKQSRDSMLTFRNEKQLAQQILQSLNIYDLVYVVIECTPILQKMLKPYANCYMVQKNGDKTKIKGKTISVEKLKNLKDVTELLLAQMAIQRKKQLSNYSETPRPKRPPPQDCYSTIHTPNSCRHNCCQHVVCCPSCRN